MSIFLFPDEGHGIVRLENRMRFFVTAEAFFARHLGGRMEPISETQARTTPPR